MEDGAEIVIGEAALDAGAAARAVACAEAGGIDVFVGTTRAERDAGGRELSALEYEAYPEMAVVEIGRIVERARDQWKVLRVVVWHRVGRVSVGEASVVIAVSAAHRGEAFAACKFLIDEVKKTAPIWKKEIFVGGEKWQGEAGA